MGQSAEKRRSKSAGSRGADRRATDDGGHYVAARFNGPSGAFNHFAQDANFNRGAYRVMENEWAANVRAGHRVSVDIVPHYDGLSRRPDRIAVTWTVDGKSISALSRTKAEAGTVADDKYDILGPLYSEIGGELAEIVGGDPDGAYLYTEAGEGWVSASAFKEEGKSVRYFKADWPLCDLIMKAWRAEDPDKRWAVMEYSVTGTAFDVKFKFPEEIDTTKTEVERRPIALKARYGDKLVIYPPQPPGMEFKGKAD